MDRNQKSTRTMNVILWICQAILSVIFGMAGIMKTTSPIADLAAQLGYPGDLPAWMVRFIGASELTGAVGVVFPSLLRIKPKLTVWAASGLGMVMIMALIFHIARGEMFAIPINLGFGLLAAFVAWGRSKKALIKEK